MKHILTVIGARPQIIKAAAINRAIRNSFADQLRETVLHTGQHYDQNMSQVFLEELGVSSPGIQLSVGSGGHGAQTARMLEGIEDALLTERPDALLVYGDTNSTVAAALAAVKLEIPLVHVEAGLRSYNKAMPEEVNRIMTDHCSTLLFSPTRQGIENLEKEGFTENSPGPHSADNPGVFHCGDVMYDNSLFFADKAAQLQVAARCGVTGDFGLVTLHRPSNTDNPEVLMGICETFLKIAERLPLILPLHPRTRARLEANLPEMLERLDDHRNLHLIPPVSFLEMIDLENTCSIVLTDSGGVQKEAFFFRKPCVILREETEWVEIVENGNALLAGPSPQRIHEAFERLSTNQTYTYPTFYGDGRAAAFICQKLIETLA